MKNLKLAASICIGLSAISCGTAKISNASNVSSARSGTGPFKIAVCDSGNQRIQLNVAADIGADSATLLGFGGVGTSNAVDYAFAGDVEQTNLNVSIVSAGSYTKRFTYKISTSTNYVDSAVSSSELSRVEVTFMKQGSAYLGTLSLNYRSGYVSEFASFNNCVFSNVEELLFKVAR